MTQYGNVLACRCIKAGRTCTCGCVIDQSKQEHIASDGHPSLDESGCYHPAACAYIAANIVLAAVAAVDGPAESPSEQARIVAELHTLLGRLPMEELERAQERLLLEYNAIPAQ